jgi:hypothetical protein
MIPQSLLAALDHRPLTCDEAKVLTVLASEAMAEEVPVPAQELGEEISKIFDSKVASSFFMQVLIKRLERTPYTYSPLTVVFCGLLADRVGEAVQWAYTIFMWGRRNGRPMMLKDWCHAFPAGPPTEEESHRIWGQRRSAWKSPRHLSRVVNEKLA